MRDLIDRPEWVSKQYEDDRNLNVRIALHKRFSTSTDSWTAWVLDQIAHTLALQLGAEASLPLRVLEIGAGPALLWSENARRIPAGWRLFLSDLSPGMAASAQRHLAEAGVDASLLVAGAEQIPLASSTCHAVVANHMLYHVTDRTRALEEIRRVLLPNGALIAATNGEGHLQELHDLAHRFEPTHAPEDPAPRKFSLESGERELANHFADVTVLRKPNLLVVTEAEPLAAYMLSGSPAAIPPARQAELHAFIERELAKDGSIRITPETGLLIAHRPLPL